MTEFCDKIHLLRSNGYKFDWRRELYYNTDTKRMITREFVCSVTLKELTEVIGYQFYFVETPSDEVKKDLIDLIEKSMRPVE